MCPDSGLSPEDDIQQALQQAQAPTEADSGSMSPAPGEVIAETHHCPMMALRYAMTKCSLKAEKYPCHTTAALLLCAGCAWICTYFGATMLAALALLAIFTDD